MEWMRVRSHPLLPGVLLALLLALPARAGTVTVDVAHRRVDTSFLHVVFDGLDPDVVTTLTFAPWGTLQNLVTTDAAPSEYWGESIRNLVDDGFSDGNSLESASFSLTSQSASQAVITINTGCTGQPTVTTIYTFYADQPYFVVDRTIHFAAAPESVAYQAFAPRLSQLHPYMALRYRGRDHVLRQRIYCFDGCRENDWDGTWLENVTLSGTRGLSVASIFDSSVPAGSTFVRGQGQFSASDWAAPLGPAVWHTADEHSRVMFAFSTTVTNIAHLDSLHATFATLPEPLLASASAPRPETLRLAAAPVPARGPVTLSWAMPRADRAELGVYDLGGRRVVTLYSGIADAGPHTATWDGRDGGGGVAPPGLYFARLLTPAGARVTRVVRAR